MNQRTLLSGPDKCAVYQLRSYLGLAINLNHIYLPRMGEAAVMERPVTNGAAKCTLFITSASTRLCNMLKKKPVPITVVNLVRAITNFFPTQGNFYACTFSPPDRLASNSPSLNPKLSLPWVLMGNSYVSRFHLCLENSAFFMHYSRASVFFWGLNEYLWITQRGGVYCESDWPYFTIKCFLINNSASCAASQFTKFLLCRITTGKNPS